MPHTPVKKGQKSNRFGRSAPRAEATTAATTENEHGKPRKKRSLSRLRRVISETDMRGKFVRRPSVQELATLPKPFSHGSATATASQSQRSQTFPKSPPTQNSTMDEELRRYFSHEQLPLDPPSRLTQITSATSATSAVEPGVSEVSQMDLSSSDDETVAAYILRKAKEVKEGMNPFQRKKK